MDHYSLECPLRLYGTTLVPRYCSQFAIQAIFADAPNQPLVSTILPSTEPDAKSSIACLASSSGKVV
jgi:hypothetical protein